jgi:hypothetical protein
MELWRQYENPLHMLTAGLSLAFIAAVAVGLRLDVG